MHHHRAVEAVGNDGLFVAAEIVAKFGGIAVVLEHRDGFFVGDSRETEA